MGNQRNPTQAATRGVEGFTLFELLTVVAILGILAAMAAPSMVRMLQRQETKASASEMAGLLSDARARAVAEGTPHLVYFNPPSVDANGECSAAAVEVRDVDHSYSITAGDDQREFRLPASSCGKVTPYGRADAATPVAEVPMPKEDLAVRAPDASLVGAVATRASGNSGQGSSSSGSGSGNSQGEDSGTESEGGPATLATDVASLARSSKVIDTVVNGATFPVDATSGLPVIAFSEHGIPVDPADPNAWGSGAGGVYLTDGDSTVYAALVEPLGDVKLRVFDPATQTWQ
jgi:prepilin-type N-terminal cleavage/methylation domain-containing protein